MAYLLLYKIFIRMPGSTVHEILLFNIDGGGVIHLFISIIAVILLL